MKLRFIIIIFVMSSLQQISAMETHAALTDANELAVLTQLIMFASKKAEALDTRLLEEWDAKTTLAMKEVFAHAVSEKKSSLIEKILPLVENPTFAANALFNAINSDDISTAEFLIPKVNVNAQNESGQTALMLVTEKANTNPEFFTLISLLYNAKADGKITDSSGRIFLDYTKPELMNEMPRWVRQFEQYMKGRSL